MVRKRAATLFTDFALITIAEVLATYSSRLAGPLSVHHALQ